MEGSTDGGRNFAALTGPSALAPAFNAGTTAYTATVGYDATHVRLTPTVAVTGSTVQVGKTGSLASVSSGSASRSIALDEGANAIIVRVTAANRSTRDYTVSVTRNARPTVSLSASPNPVTPQADPNDPDLKSNKVTITATLSVRLTGIVSIPVTLTQDDNADHGVISDIVIGGGNLTGGHKIIVLEDVDTEDDTFTVSLDTANLPSSVAAGSSPSVTVTIRDSDSKAAPGALSNFTITPKARYLLLNWDKPTARTTHYDVQFKTAAAPNQAGSNNDPSTGWISLPTYGDENVTERRATVPPNGLTSGTAHDVRVRAVNWTAAGPWATGQGTPKEAGGL